MDESTAAKCCVCHKSSYWFYDNISTLQSRQSTRTIPVILKLIMGEELSIDWTSSGAMCFECVDKINDYDEAFEKMQLIERELKQIHKATRVKLENEGFFSMNANAICDGNAMAFDVTTEDFTLENFADPLDYVGELMQPQSIDSSKENQRDEAESENDCKYCGVALNNSIGLKIHIARVHKDKVQAECTICHETFPTEQHLENHKMTTTCKSTDVSCPICQEHFRTKRCLSAHMSKHRTNKIGPPFDCEFCGATFDDHGKLNEHKELHQDLPRYQCLKCDYIGKTTSLLRQHMRSHARWNETSGDSTSRLEFPCNRCPQSYSEDRSLKNHMKNAHHISLPSPLECILCGIEVDTPDELDEHIAHHSDRLEHQCIECQYIGSTTTLLKQHMRSHTRWHQCGMCGKGSINEILLQKHMDRHEKGEITEKLILNDDYLGVKFPCNHCPKTYSEMRYLKTHMKHAHKILTSSPLECELCGLGLDTPDELDEHKSQHSTRSQYQCVECEYTGSATKLLKQHMRSHTRWNQCDLCGKGLISASALQKHMNKHESGEIANKLAGENDADDSGSNSHSQTLPDSPDPVQSDQIRTSGDSTDRLEFRCNRCPHSYSEERSLKNHMKSAHLVSLPSPLECILCGIEVDTPDELDEHIVHHSNRLKYQCTECQYIGSATKLLKQHMRSHTRWHQCGICGKGLINGTLFQKHMDRHERGEITEKLISNDDYSGVKFPCNHCPKTFSGIRYLKLHMRHAHKLLASSPLECELCGLELDTADELDEHKSLHSTRLQYQCVECKYTGTAPKLLKQHMRSHTRWNQCDLCQKGLINETSLRKHMNRHENGEIVDKSTDENCADDSTSNSHNQDQPNHTHPVLSSSNQNQVSPNTESLLVEIEMKLDTDEAESVKAVKCEECKETFDSAHGLKIHKARKHAEPESLKCSVCHRIFKRMFLLKRHRADSSCNKMDFACKLCPKRFSELRYLKSHIVCAHKILTSSPLECEFCGIELDTSEQLDEHKSHHSNRLHNQCVECEYVGAARSFLRQHMHSHTRWHQCSICGKGLINAAELQKHKKIHGTDLKSECYICKYRTISARRLREHMRIEHTGAKPYKCSECGKEYVCKNHLKNHFSFHSEPQSGNGDSQFDCDKCGKTYQTELSLKIHKGNVHKDGGRLKCPICPAKFTNKRNLKLHEERHVAWNLNQIHLQCELCEKQFSNSSGMNRHISRFHREIGRFECMVCHKFYPNKLLLQKHTGSATCRERNFKCEICTKQFALPHNYKEHMKMHNISTEMEPPFYCDYCRLEFQDYQALCVHKELHLNRPDFECVICDYKTDKKINLQAHTRIHREVGKRNICDVCGKFFKSRELLFVHLKYHTDDLHVECYICKWRTLSTSKMQEHMRKHTGEKPFPCTECGKRFSRNSNMRTHLRLHFGPSEKRHKCTVCEATFTRTGKLSEHYLKEHGLNVKPTTNRLIKVKR